MARRWTTIGIVAVAGWSALAPAGTAQVELWALRGARPDASFGSVARLDDWNGDGVDDFAVGESGDFWNFSTEPGRVYVYSGLDRTLLHELVGDGPGDCFGFSVADAGDVDGDGLGDLAVGAMQWIDWMTTDLGYVRLFSGADGSEIRTLHGTQLDAAFGGLVSGAGDVDADGFDDLLVSAQWESVGGVAYAGAMHLYSGQTGAELFTFGGTAFFNYCGTALAGIGDVNVDGHDDFLVGSFGESVNGAPVGAARVFSGKDYSVLRFQKGSVDWGDFGMAVAGGSDLDGDGVPDYAIGAPASDSGFELGRVTIYSGATGAVLRLHGGLAAGDIFGSTIDLRSDLDGDGTNDVVIGAPWATLNGSLLGACYAFSGATGAQLMNAFGRNDGGDPLLGSSFGSALAGLGDADGDGLDELLIGASTDLDAPGSTVGAAYLLTLADVEASWSNYGAGWPGTLCEPTLVVDAPPALGTTITLSLANSAGVDTTALLFAGGAQAFLPTKHSGTYLVAPPWISLLLPLPAAGLDLDLEVPPDLSLVGVEIDAQAIELDPGASRGVSFTPGLQLLLGGR